MRAPCERDAIAIARAVLDASDARATRFPTGLHHWVYDVETDAGERAVVRIGAPESRPHLAGAVFWEERLRPLDIPLPRLLHADLDARHSPFPSLVLERLPGTDLGEVYDDLGTRQRRALAREMALLQRRAAGLPNGTGFGYALDYRGRTLLPAWTGLLSASVDRGEQWIAQAGVITAGCVAPVRALLAELGPSLENTEPVAFLHDITTKNVIVHEGRLSGIVDVDSMCFGDPLWTIALTRMSLLASGRSTDYIDFWCEAAALSSEGHRALDLYTAIHGVHFLGELGQAFNRASAEPIDPAHRDHLLALVSRLCG